ncbi:MAG: TolC family protein [Candidatus Omnitrophota bacterium]
MKIAITFLLVSLLLYSGPVLAEEIPLSVDEAVALALRNNRDVLLKAEDVKKAKEKIAEAEAARLPSLTVSAGESETRGYYSKELTQTSTQTTLKQYLYKGGKTASTIKQNEYKSEVSGALLDKTKLDVTLSVKKAFYTLLLSEEFVHLNKSIVDNTKEHLSTVRERYKSGQASESDVLAIEASLAAVEQAYEFSLNQKEISRVLLNNLLYLDDATRIKPNVQFIYEVQDFSYDEGLLKAMKNRPEIKQYEVQLKSDKLAVDIAKADNRPSIYASWDYYSRSHNSATSEKGWNDYNVIGITFSWPIFDGFATKAKVEQAIIDVRETQLLKEKTINDIAMELKNAYLSLSAALTGLETTGLDMTVYSDNLKNIKEKHAQGIMSTLDLDDATLKHDIALFNNKQAVYDCLIARSTADKAMGYEQLNNK